MFQFNPTFQRGNCQYCRAASLPGETVCKAHRNNSYEEENAFLEQSKRMIKQKQIEALKEEGFVIKEPVLQIEQPVQTISYGPQGPQGVICSPPQGIICSPPQGFVQPLIELPETTLDTKQVIKMNIPERLNPAEYYIKTRETQKEIIMLTYKTIGTEIEKDSNAGKFSTTFTIKNCADYLYNTLWSILEEDGFEIVMSIKDDETVFIITWKNVANDKFIPMVKNVPKAPEIGDSLSLKPKKWVE